jgi:hypothetical protein
MTLEEINYIAQTVGVVAILGTFVAVLIQMRQTNRLLRNQAKRSITPGLGHQAQSRGAGFIESVERSATRR